MESNTKSGSIGYTAYATKIDPSRNKILLIKDEDGELFISNSEIVKKRTQIEWITTDGMKYKGYKD